MTNVSNKFRFVKASAVAVGAFNTNIVHPAWLHQVKILPAHIEPEVQIDFQQPGLKLSCKEYGTWIVRPDRLMIETSDPPFFPGRMISQILDLLPWTPVSAVGLNYRFEGLELPAMCAERLGFPLSYEHDRYEIAQRSWHVSLKKATSPTVRNVQLSLSEEKNVLTVNFHTETEQVIAEEISQTILQLSDSFNEAQRLAMDVFSIDLS